MHSVRHRHSSHRLSALNLSLAVLIALAFWLVGGAPASANGGPWHFDHPLPQGNTLRGLWSYTNFSGGTNVVAVGDAGTILLWTPTSATWSPMPNNTYRYLYAVWGRPDASDIYAVGEGGVILHQQGSGWIEESSGTTNDLNAVWGTSTAVYAVGSQGTILKNTGSGWTTLESGTNSWLGGIWGSSGSDIFAVGEAGTILHSANGTSWTPMTNDSSNSLHSIWGSAPNNVWAVGDAGAILHYNGVAWADPIANPAGADTLTSVTGVPGGYIYAAGVNGHIVRSYNGGAWTDFTPPGAFETLNAIVVQPGSPNNRLFAVGEYGTIYRHSGVNNAASGWARRGGDGILSEQHAIWGSGASDIYSVGMAGTILHYDGASWTDDHSGVTTHLEGVWGSGSTVFAVGEAGEILRKQGGAWSQMNSNTGESLRGVWGTSPSNVFAAGSEGVILHYDGNPAGAWSRMAVPDANLAFYALWGSSGTDVWAAGNGNQIYHYDGSQWTAFLPGDVGGQWMGIWGTGPNDVWFLNWWSVVRHWDGNTLSDDIEIPGGPRLFSIWGAGSSDIYAVGGDGYIAHFNGTTWTPMAVPIYGGGVGVYDVRSVWGNPASGVHAVGSGGIILHYAPFKLYLPMIKR